MSLYSPIKRLRFASVTLLLTVVVTSTLAIQEGLRQNAQLIARTTCGDGVCETGEDRVVCPLECPPETPRELCSNCLMICPIDCDPDYTPPVVDPCDSLNCPLGCENGACLTSEDLCKNIFCVYGCKNGQCLLAPSAPSCDPYVCADESEYPRCNEDDSPINYLVDPCTTAGIFCHSSDDCQEDMTCSVELGDCLSDPACPDCDVCVGTCIHTGQSSASSSSSLSSVPHINTMEEMILSMRSQSLLPEPTKNWFSDTNLDNEVTKSANLLRDAGIINGYPDGTFRRYNPVIRAEAAKMLLQARYGEFPKTNNTGEFWDVDDNAWYMKYVIGAAKLGIIDGYPDKSFRPGNTVNTAEFLKMLIKTFDLKTGVPYYYSDVSPNAWFAQYVGITEKMNLFPERITKLQPEKLLTRGEVAHAIARVIFLTGSE